MRAKLLVNDLHLGVQRATGTTPASAAALRGYLVENFEPLLHKHRDKDAIVNGDLFDAFNVPLLDLLAAYNTLSGWLQQSDGSLILGRGNHDWSKDSAKMSSFDLLGRLLSLHFPGRVRVVEEPEQIEAGLYMVPHLPNQDLLDLALKACEARENELILLHANYDNGYTLESDHSLNVSKEQAERLIAKGHCLVFGHEHQGKRAIAGQVFITGNQFPSSVADCLGNPDNAKYAHILTPSETDWDVEAVCTWDAAGGGFHEMSWDELQTDGDAQFVRIGGKATAEQGPDVVEAIAKFRQASNAFVVANAVKIDGVADMADLPASMEEVKAFDVLGYLLENLDEPQQAVVRKLLANADEREAT